jgi:hypothetical protein
MAIRFFCSTCGQKFEVADSMAGRNAQCPHCRGITEIPSPRPAAPTTPAPASPSLPVSEPVVAPVRQQTAPQPAKQQPAQPKPAAARPAEAKPAPATAVPVKPVDPKPAERIAAKSATRVVAKAVEPSPKPAGPATVVKPVQPAPDEDIYVLVDELVDEPPLGLQPAARPSSPSIASARAPSEPASAAWPPQPQAAPVDVEDDYALAPLDDDPPAVRSAPQPVSSESVPNGSAPRGTASSATVSNRSGARVGSTPAASKAGVPPDKDDLSDLLSAEPVVPLAGGLAPTGAFAMTGALSATDDFATADSNSLGFFADELTPAARGPSPDASGPRCPSCRAVLATDSNICLDCGLDFRTGKRVPKPAAVDMSRSRKRPLGSMWIVSAGLYMMFFAMVLFAVSSLMSYVPALAIISLVPAGLSMLLATLASILCVFVPARTGALPPIVMKLVLDISMVVVMVSVLNKSVHMAAAAAVPVLMFVSVLCFIFFMKHLALYVDRRDVADDAMNLIWFGLMNFLGGIGAVFVAMIVPPLAFVAGICLSLAGIALIFKFGLVAKDLAGAVRGR